MLDLKIDISDTFPLNPKKYKGYIMARIQISNDPSGRIIASSPYNPLLIAGNKTIDGYKWYPTEKPWNFPELKKFLERFLKLLSEIDKPKKSINLF